MLLITKRFIFDLDDIKWVNVYDREHIRITYKNNDTEVFNISFEEFSQELSTKHVI